MKEVRLLEIVYETLAEHEPLRRAIIEVRRQQGEQAIQTVLSFIARKPSVQLGEFQDIDEEVDVEAAHKLGVDLFRRVGGGGCLFYDDQTRFAVALLDRAFFADLEAAAKVWQGEAITGIFRSLGVPEVWYRHIGDVLIGPSKVSGLGTAYLQNTLYLGSFMNIGTPRIDLASQILKIPPEKFADKPVSTLAEYVSSVEKVTGRLPSPEEFREALCKNLEGILNIQLIPGELSPEEKRVFKELFPIYTSKQWIFKRSSRNRFQDLPVGARLGKKRRKARKLVIAQVAVADGNKINQAMLSGDFFIQPGEALEEIEKNLQGVRGQDEKEILRVVEETLSRLQAQTPMLTPEDFALPIAAAAQEALLK